MRDRARYEPIARQAAMVAGIDPDLFVAQITVESHWDTEAVSKHNAVGIAQIIPRWHPDVNPRDPVAALQYAANLMASYVREFGSERLALQAYNGGPSSLRATGTPPPNTAGYAQTILDARDALRQGQAGDIGTRADTTMGLLASSTPLDRRWVMLIAAAVAAVLMLAVAE
jgi:soluble lytic murein transglycosylase-like protein